MTVRIYDTTLRDGAQGEGFQLSVPEKLLLTELLDDLGVAYIEGGWPGSNPRDEAYFTQAGAIDLQSARLAAFGSTHRKGVTCENDPSIQALVAAATPVITIFGKSSKFQATEILGVTPEENLALISETVEYLKRYADEVIFDAEHFFDGADEDEEYALSALAAAAEAGAHALVLCDTNGGALPGRVAELVAESVRRFDAQTGIHTHNDGELAVANALAAVEAGATQVQGTINGYGERCGNANLISIIAALELKMGIRCLPEGMLRELTRVSRTVDEMTNYVPLSRQPYVGRSAFAHKGGIHVNAVMKTTRSYEHIDPELVGNTRRILVSDLSGRSNIVFKAQEFGMDLDPDDLRTREVLERIKRLENAGYQFEGAEASLQLLIAEAQGRAARFFEVHHATVSTELGSGRSDRDAAEDGQLSVAKVKVEVAGEVTECTAEGNGPVHALGTALRDILQRAYPVLENVRLTDYRVRILAGGAGLASVVRVLVRVTDGRSTWGTVGVSSNVIEASWAALVDGFRAKLMKDRVAEAVVRVKSGVRA
jgi:2-isopropylmalate synthase